MNILQAKNEIKNAMKIYLEKDRYGRYVIPVESQRPIFLLGPPGIGKTAIMEQIAHELNIGILSYSMTHHTRQSALGLPFISQKSYDGEKYDVSEYTMSEIISAVYDAIELSGMKEGILFLDEINCVSETLVPAMLQFLQYKTFGRHKVPEGWIVVAAGNPPEFNRSAREFDIVTWDRLRRLNVETDYAVWRKYAVNNGVHPAVLTYLDSKKSDFYIIENTVDGKRFVTARGWFDLSQIIGLYEKNNIPVTEQLISQYLQHERVSLDFASYYELFTKYRSDYQAENIIDGKYSDELIERARNASFDERSSLIGIILDLIFDNAAEVYLTEMMLMDSVEILRELRANAADKDAYADKIDGCIAEKRRRMAAGKLTNSISKDAHEILFRTSEFLSQTKNALLKTDHSEPFDAIKAEYDKQLQMFNASAENITTQIGNAIGFIEECCGEGQELLLLITELTVNKKCAHIIDRFGCEKYYEHSQKLLLSERMNKLVDEIKKLGI